MFNQELNSCFYSNKKDKLKNKGSSVLNYLLQNQNLTEDYILSKSKQFNDYQWDLIFENQRLSKDFLMKNFEKININCLSLNTKIKRNLIEEIIILKKLC